MKHRKPEGEPPVWTAPPAEARGWREFQVTTITPIYGGGVSAGEPDPELPVRAAAIRGQLRFWWRLLNRERYTDSRALFRAERDIWGGMAEYVKSKDGKQWNSIGPSKVMIRVSGLQGYRAEACAKYVWNDKTGRYKGMPEFQKNMSAYALFSGQGKLANGSKLIEKYPAQVVMPGLQFTLMIACDDMLWHEARLALRWWASFGGLGARTRRGLGSVKVEGLDPITREEVAATGGRLATKLQDDNSMRAWNMAIGQLQKFRQGKEIGRNKGSDPKVPLRLGRSHWPEPDVIRRKTGKERVKSDNVSLTPCHPAGDVLPRAFFGLPIIFHFQSEKNDKSPDPGDTQLVPEDMDRFASPLVLKAMWNGKGYSPIALLLPTVDQLRSRTLVLKNSGDGKDLKTDIPFAPGDWWPTDEAAAAEKCAEIKPMQDRGVTDPLTAFLDFFEKGR